MSLPVFCIACFGAAFTIGHSKLSLPFRKWLFPGSKIDTFQSFIRIWLLWLLECPACLGFHFGWSAVLLGVPIGVDFGNKFLTAVAVGFACCGTNLLLAKYAGLDEQGEEDV